MDGTPTLRMTDFVIGALTAGKIDLGPAASSKPLAAPKELKFVVDAKTEANIKRAESDFDALVSQHYLHVRCRVSRYLARVWVLTISSGATLRGVREGVHQGPPRVAGRVGAAREAARVPQDVRAPGRVLRERADAQVPARTHGGHPLREQREQGVGGGDAGSQGYGESFV